MNVLEQARMIRVAMDRAGAALTDAQALESVMLYRNWLDNETVEVDDVRRSGDQIYRCIQRHKTQADWKPENTPALWARIEVSEWPEWVQPTGAQDAYGLDAKVTHNGVRWVSVVQANVWEPSVYGWNRH